MNSEIDKLYRELYSKMVSSLISYFGLKNFALAEDIVQETFVTAMDKWAVEGMPDDPQAWLFQVCKNKTINALQKPSTKIMEGMQLQDAGILDSRLEHLFLDHEIKDNQLRLLFACCHPTLSPKAQLILILKNLCGLKVTEIARALLMTDDAVMKSLTRSKQTLSTENVSLYVPFLMRSHDRLNIVHTSLYLMFNEGYSASQGNDLIRSDLCIESIRLVKTILDIPEIRNHDTYALFSLMCFHSARFDARLGTEGEIIELEHQDRSKWDKELIKLGVHYFKEAYNTNKTSRFVLEAAIASVHSIAKKFEQTNWPVIVGLYDRLTELQSTPFIDLNRAVALYYARGPQEALNALENSRHLSWLKNYYLYYATLGKIYIALNQNSKAVSNYEKALSLTTLKAEQDFLQKKILTIQTNMN
jgi:RNA polymerase sigma factor (sigma-70 family)